MFLSWDEIREMNENGIEFGSHTVSHPFLPTLKETILEYELKESKTRIENETGRRVTALSYPYAGLRSFNARVKDTARSAGYDFGMGFYGVNDLRKSDPFALRRLPVESGDSLDILKIKLWGVEL